MGGIFCVAWPTVNGGDASSSSIPYAHPGVAAASFCVPTRKSSTLVRAWRHGPLFLGGCHNGSKGLGISNLVAMVNIIYLIRGRRSMQMLRDCRGVLHRNFGNPCDLPPSPIVVACAATTFVLLCLWCLLAPVAA